MYADKLYPFYLATIGADYRTKWAFDAIQYYVFSGRAPYSWEVALYKATPAKILAHMSRRGGSHDDMIAACTAYLRRHCGLAA